MANRVTEDEVRDIIKVDATITDISAHIIAANLLVTAKLGDKGLGDDLLKEVERWLSAHFVAIHDPRAMREKIGEAEINYQFRGQIGVLTGLNATPYGQQAVALDTSGTLANLGKRKAMVEAISPT